MLCVFLGFVTVVILSIGTDTVLEQVGFFPPIGEGLFERRLLIIALLYRSLFTILGGYVTATLAPTKPMKHVMILGLIGTVAGTLGIIVGWNLSEHWYPIALALTAYPFVWMGGRLRVG